MKNIHLIRTEEKSRLFKHGDRLDIYPKKLIPKSQGLCINQFIYITNTDELNDNQYCISYGSDKCNGKVDSFNSFVKYSRKPLKITLTNDPKLIADGVQELTEEQLQDIVYKYPLGYVKVMYEPKNFMNVTEGWEYCLHFNSFSAENIINNWLDKNGTKEINKEVEMEAERYNKLISDFENMEGIISSMFDEKDWIRFERFVERQEKEDLGYTTKLGIEVPNEMVIATIIPKQYFGEKETKQQGKELTTEEVMEGRSSAYNFLDFNDSPEKETLEKIKFVLSANNESQAIRFIEQYGEWAKENCRKEFKTEIDKISLTNEDINSWGDGFEYAIKEVNKYLKYK